MSFLKHKRIIEEGDQVVIYMTINNLHAIDVTPEVINKKGQKIEHTFQTRFFNKYSINVQEFVITSIFH